MFRLAHLILFTLLLTGCSTWPRATTEHEYCFIQSFGWRLLASPPSNQLELLALIKTKGKTEDVYWFSKTNGDLLFCELRRTPVVTEEYRRRGCMSRRTHFSEVNRTWLISDETANACVD